MVFRKQPLTLIGWTFARDEEELGQAAVWLMVILRTPTQLALMHEIIDEQSRWPAGLSSF